ncbi:MAG: DUF1015 domain-containing protein [Spirochaetales bacterium]
MNLLKNYGIRVPDILLPKSDVDLKSWAVIACDQYTQDENYWKQAADIAKNKPSALHMILPEIYLDDEEKKNERIQNIRKTMKEYIDTSIFSPPLHDMIYIERQTAFQRCRKGCIVAIDLEDYDWKPFSKALIRSTEATITDRIPPRIAVRKDSPLEIPHIMLLINDAKDDIIKTIASDAKKQKPLYDTDLMLNGGHITGWTVNAEKNMSHILKSLSELAKKNTTKDGSTFLFAVGDGNHSLATAKTVWEEVKKNRTASETEDCPERYALAEIVNIYDEGLTFEPIHRIICGIKPHSAIEFLQKNMQIIVQDCDNFDELQEAVAKNIGAFGLLFQDNNKTSYMCVKTESKNLTVSIVQPVLDLLAEHEKKENPRVFIDYIHGTAELCRLSQKENTLGILLPPIEKNAFFNTISEGGPLPRKSFSMGEADEKRFYLEARQGISTNSGF